MHNPKTILSWGLGTESSAILARWCLSWILEQGMSSVAQHHFARPLAELQPYQLAPGFEPENLTVITAQLGSEHEDTTKHCESWVLPLLRLLGIRFLEVAKAGSSVADGVIVLQDTTQPERLHQDGAYRLFDELKAAGVLPSFAGDHLCALKHKAAVIEEVVAYLCDLDDAKPERIRRVFGYNRDEESRINKSELAFTSHNGTRRPQSYRLTFGYNAEEERRIAKAKLYDVAFRQGHYPLQKTEWNWGRQDCIGFLKQAFGVDWGRSCCLFCPFAKPDEERLTRLRRFPHAVTETLLLEHGSLSMNPRGTLYQKQSFREMLDKEGITDGMAEFEQIIANAPHALFQVRRIYSAKGKADRCTEQIQTGNSRDWNRAEMMTAAEELQKIVGGTWRMTRGIRYLDILLREEDVYPTRECFYVVAPAWIAAKTRHGLASFNQRWEAIGRPQLGLFGERPLHYV